MNAKDLIKRIKEDKVNFISLQFTDVMGAVKSVDMPLHNLEGALEDGVWFDGSSVEGFARIQESDMRLVLDPDTYAVLPWCRRTGAGRACSATSSCRMGNRSRAIRAAC